MAVSAKMMNAGNSLAFPV